MQLSQNIKIKLVLCSSAAKQLLYNYPWVYDYNLPAAFDSVSPSMQAAMDGKHIKAAPWSRVTTLTSLGGRKFVSFAKYTDFGAGTVTDLCCDIKPKPSQIWELFYSFLQITV